MKRILILSEDVRCAVNLSKCLSNLECTAHRLRTDEPVDLLAKNDLVVLVTDPSRLLEGGYESEFLKKQKNWQKLVIAVDKCEEGGFSIEGIKDRVPGLPVFPVSSRLSLLSSFLPQVHGLDIAQSGIIPLEKHLTEKCSQEYLKASHEGFIIHQHQEQVKKQREIMEKIKVEIKEARESAKNIVGDFNLPQFTEGKLHEGIRQILQRLLIKLDALLSDECLEKMRAIVRHSLKVHCDNPQFNWIKTAPEHPEFDYRPIAKDAGKMQLFSVSVAAAAPLLLDIESTSTIYPCLVFSVTNLLYWINRAEKKKSMMLDGILQEQTRIMLENKRMYADILEKRLLNVIKAVEDVMIS